VSRTALSLVAVAVALVATSGCQQSNGSTTSTSRVRSEVEPRIAPREQPRLRTNTPTRALNDPDHLTDDSEPVLFRQLDETFKRKGEVKDHVYRLVTPRTDLFVTMDGRDVATGAFLESDFRFWRCPCGKLLVNGQFVLADYEVNDDVDELQKGELKVVSIGPLLLHEQPRLLMVRFQGEGDAPGIATALRSALSYTAEERSKPLPADLSPRAD